MDPPYDSQPRPALARLKSLALTALAAAAFWVVALAMATAYVFIEREQNLVYTMDMVPGSVLSVLFGVVLFIALRAMLLRVAHLPFWRQAAIAAILVLAFAAPYEYVFRAMQSVVLPQDDVRLLPLNLRVLIPATVFWTPPFGVWAVGVLALTHETNARRREQWLTEARAQAHQAQVRALRYQINPHFLYNTLNSIAALILDKRGETAEAMVIRLSDFFRSSLAQDPLSDATLAGEIALQRLYLDIEEVRFADQLEVAVDLPAELEDALVPSLILQPLVENALKHGLRGPCAPMRLTISARHSAGELFVEVADNGRGTAAGGAPGTGVGMENVRARLATRFPGRGRLETQASEEGFTARLSMPLEYA